MAKKQRDKLASLPEHPEHWLSGMPPKLQRYLLDALHTQIASEAHAASIAHRMVERLFQGVSDPDPQVAVEASAFVWWLTMSSRARERLN